MTANDVKVARPLTAARVYLHLNQTKEKLRAQTRLSLGGHPLAVAEVSSPLVARALMQDGPGSSRRDRGTNLIERLPPIARPHLL